jgi:hypothetical protein
MGLNLTLSGYFCKVVMIMISTQAKEFCKYIISGDYVVLDQLVEHIDNKSICELFIKILLELSDYNENAQDIPDVLKVL